MATSQGRPPMKLVTLSSYGSGKSVFVYRLATPNLNLLPGQTGNFKPVDYQRVVYHFNDEDFVPLDIWDTNANERFNVLSPLYYRKAEGVFLMYNIIQEWNEESLDYWYNEAIKHIPDAIVILIGTHLDLAGDAGEEDMDDDEEVEPNQASVFSLNRRRVLRSQAAAWAYMKGIDFYEVSSITGQNVKIALDVMVKKAMANRVERPIFQQHVDVDYEEKDKTESSGYCY